MLIGAASRKGRKPVASANWEASTVPLASARPDGGNSDAPGPSPTDEPQAGRMRLPIAWQALLLVGLPAAAIGGFPGCARAARCAPR